MINKDIQELTNSSGPISTGNNSDDFVKVKATIITTNLTWFNTTWKDLILNHIKEIRIHKLPSNKFEIDLYQDIIGREDHLLHRITTLDCNTLSDSDIKYIATSGDIKKIYEKSERIRKLLHSEKVLNNIEVKFSHFKRDSNRV